MSAAVTGTLTDKAAVYPGRALYIRAKATTARFASAPLVLNAPARPATPTYGINYGNETTNIAISSADQVADNAGMTSAALGNEQVRPVQPGQNLYFRTAATSTSFASAVQTLAVPQRPATPAFTIDYANETTTQLLASTDEYSTNSTLSGAITGNGTKVAVSPSQNLYFRKKATATAFKSAIQSLTVPARPATPAYTLNFLTEKTSQALKTTDEYATSANMTGALPGTGTALAVTPGQALYLRVKAGSSNFRSGVQTLSVPARPSAPVYTINFVQEKTNEMVPSTAEYARTADMAAATAGTGAALAVVPGEALYLRSKATTTSFASSIASVQVPARPATPVYTIDYIGEKTLEPVQATVEYASAETMEAATSGAGTTIPVVPGTSLYVRTKASATSFASAVFSLEVKSRPEAPGQPIVNDEEDTFGWTYTPAFQSPSSYEYSTDGGTRWTVSTSNPLTVGQADFAAGSVQVRIKATASNFKSDPLLSTEAFTRALGLPGFSQVGVVLYPNPASDKLFLNALPEKATLNIYSLDGKLVKTYQLKQENNQLDISELQSGVYLLQLRGSKLNTQIRLLKQ